jgi:hypothetical protein
MISSLQTPLEAFLPSPTLYQDARTCIASLPANPVRNTSYQPDLPAPNAKISATVVNLAHSSQDSGETSYIEWDDDDDEGPSTVSRLLKSVNELRAVESFLSDATNRWKGYVTGSSPEYDKLTALPLTEVASRTSLEAVLDAQFKTKATKLRKKASTKGIAVSTDNIPETTKTADGVVMTEFARWQHDAILTPPSTRKRKRANKASSQTSQVSQAPVKKKTKGNAVSSLVRKLLSVKKVTE